MKHTIFALLSIATIPGCDPHAGADQADEPAVTPRSEPWDLCYDLMQVCSVGIPECTEMLNACAAGSPCKACMLAGDIPEYGPDLLAVCDRHLHFDDCACEG